MIKNKKYAFKILGILTFLVIFFMPYYLLLEDNYLHCSISSIIDSIQKSALTKHLIVLGLLPIYIAIVIFGAGILGMYLGSKMEKWYSKYKQKKN